MKELLFLLLLPLQLLAQNTPLALFKKYPFPTELTATGQDSKLAWALDERGRRNVYVADGPDHTPRKLTNYTEDDGQEISSLSLSKDGKWVVFVQGGDHGSNWDDQLPVNPAAAPFASEMKLVSVPYQGGPERYFLDGDGPAISPDSKRVVFIKGGQVWTAPLDSLDAAKNLFRTRGSVGSLEWNPDGKSLLFVARRGDHALVGVYTDATTTIRWIAPSFGRDASPRWSPDGKKIVYVRMPGLGGAPDSLLVDQHQPWSLYIADVAKGTATPIWTAPTTLRGSVPSTQGGCNLHWAAGDKIVFVSYADGWPHLYSLDAKGGAPLLLTPGNFMCEQIRLSPDKKQLIFSANTGPDPFDSERRHVATVSVDKADMKVLTPGDGLEWTPVLFDGGAKVALISATAQRPPMPTVLDLKGTDKMKLLGSNLIPSDFPASKLVTPKSVIFRAADGVEVHADLFEPAGGAAKKPAVMYIHGGPSRQMLLGWHYSDYYSNAYAANQYLASLGFVVLSVNYRLGIGYGYEFQNAPNSGSRGAAEYQDIKAAGEWLKKQSTVDPKRIGVYGGSYGGFLTAMALAKDSDLFAAGVDLHGVHDWDGSDRITMQYSDKYEKAPDYEKAIETAWFSSPVSQLATWKSPVLIIHGDDDRNVHFNQSTDLINRLEKLKIPHETMMIVDDTHHWMKWSNAVKVYQAVADFFVRKLK